MKEIQIGGRVIPMTLTTFEMIAIQEEVGCTIGQLRDEVFGLEQNLETDEYSFRMLEDKDRLRRFGTLIRILGNAGLEEDGKEPDLTDKWILRHMKPGQILDITAQLTMVINDAMMMEFSGQAKDGPVDEVLAEENRKKGHGSLPTGESAPAGSSPD